mgnify:CR=1 FL=1
MKRLALSLYLAATPLLPTLAAADEVWTSDLVGTIVYEADIGDVAVFSAGDNSVHLYIEGLAGMYANAGRFQGYWLENTAGTCGSSLTGADGWVSENWGTLELEFDPNGPERSYTVWIGECGADYIGEFYATPVGAEPAPAPAPTK